uniref:Putative secreted peptide n=1 Tax=Anopheles braziliensis TaxID=58242 RepID=A0A2M3ZTJ0_9DIPT
MTTSAEQCLLLHLQCAGCCCCCSFHHFRTHSLPLRRVRPVGVSTHSRQRRRRRRRRMLILTTFEPLAA